MPSKVKLTKYDLLKRAAHLTEIIESPYGIEVNTGSSGTINNIMVTLGPNEKELAEAIAEKAREMIYAKREKDREIWREELRTIEAKLKTML